MGTDHFAPPRARRRLGVVLFEPFARSASEKMFRFFEPFSLFVPKIRTLSPLSQDHRHGNSNPSSPTPKTPNPLITVQKLEPFVVVSPACKNSNPSAPGAYGAKNSNPALQAALGCARQHRILNPPLTGGSPLRKLAEGSRFQPLHAHRVRCFRRQVRRTTKGSNFRNRRPGSKFRSSPVFQKMSFPYTRRNQKNAGSG